MNRKILKSIAILIFFVGFSIKSYATPVNSKFEDDVFYKAIIDNLNANNYNDINDRNYDYYVTDDELKSIEYFSIGNFEDKEKVRSMKGLEELTLLRSLKIKYPNIKNLDISQNIDLEYIEVLNADNLIDIDFSNNINLKNIDLTYTHLKRLNVENCKNLKSINMGAGSISSARIEEIDLSNCTELESLEISGNKLTYVDLSNNKQLKRVLLTEGNIEILILPEDPIIEELILFGNEFKTFDDIINIEKQENIKRLLIQNNYIKDFSIIEKFEKIEDLNIGKEKIEKAEDVVEESNNYKNMEKQNLEKDVYYKKESSEDYKESEKNDEINNEFCWNFFVSFIMSIIIFLFIMFSIKKIVSPNKYTNEEIEDMDNPIKEKKY